MYRIFRVHPCLSLWFACDSRGYFWLFSEPFLGIFRSSDLRPFTCVFVEGFTHECLVPLFLVICPSQTPRKAFDLRNFGWTLVLEVFRCDSQFLMIESDLGLDLRARGCPWGNPPIPKVWLQSVGWIGRSIDEKLRVDSRVLIFPCCPGRAV